MYFYSMHLKGMKLLKISCDVLMFGVVILESIRNIYYEEKSQCKQFSAIYDDRTCDILLEAIHLANNNEKIGIIGKECSSPFSRSKLS